MNQQMSNEGRFKLLFLIAALYDFILGLVFFIFWQPIFDHILKIAHPNYLAFYQAAAAFIFNMGIGFYFVYKNMYRNIDIVRMGIVFKLFYCAIAFYWVIVENMPGIFAIFGITDLIFIALFVVFLRAYNKEINHAAR